MKNCFPQTLDLNEWLNFKSFDSLKRVLIANEGLPSSSIGSWTNRFSRLLANHPGTFDFILSPTEFPSKTSIYCEKRKGTQRFLSKVLRKPAVIFSCKNYLDKLKSLLNTHQFLHLVVIDDLTLLNAIAQWKNTVQSGQIRLDFSFHGHSFILPTSWGHLVDHVFFLTKLGYLETLKSNEVFIPQIHIVGNGTDSKIFSPLSQEKKLDLKNELGYKKEDKILVWLSTNRPKKGLKLFLDLSNRLLKKYENLQILIIGASIPESEIYPRLRSIGKIPNQEISSYLQIGDIYCFTSLWKEGFGLTLIEAAKSGNIVIASQNGGIPEVIEGLPASYLVDCPNQLDSWEEAFSKAWELSKHYKPDVKFLNNFHPLQVWENKFLKALES